MKRILTFLIFSLLSLNFVGALSMAVEEEKVAFLVQGGEIVSVDRSLVNSVTKLPEVKSFLNLENVSKDVFLKILSTNAAANEANEFDEHDLSEIVRTFFDGYSGDTFFLFLNDYLQAIRLLRVRDEIKASFFEHYIRMPIFICLMEIEVIALEIEYSDFVTDFIKEKLAVFFVATGDLSAKQLLVLFSILCFDADMPDRIQDSIVDVYVSLPDHIKANDFVVKKMRARADRMLDQAAAIEAAQAVHDGGALAREDYAPGRRMGVLDPPEFIDFSHLPVAVPAVALRRSSRRRNNVVIKVFRVLSNPKAWVVAGVAIATICVARKLTRK